MLIMMHIHFRNNVEQEFEIYLDNITNCEALQKVNN